MAQGNWQTGTGNPCLDPLGTPPCSTAPLGGVGIGNNFIGTDVNNSTPLRFGTKGNENVRIDTLGNVGIGTVIPAYLLDVNGGDININTATNGYRIDSTYVLWHNSNITNIFAGVNAGSASVTGADNTFVGNNAGNATSIGNRNTFIGCNSGRFNTDGRYNTFVGYAAGDSNTLGIGNTFIGREAGISNRGDGTDQGNWNTFVGSKSGFKNTTGNNNSFYGKHSGYENIGGALNCFLGDHTGHESVNTFYNTFVGTNAGYWVQGSSNVMAGALSGFYFNAGDNNTFIGPRSQYFGDMSSYSNNISNSSAIGANVIVPDSNQMILGDNNVNVGIGLSGDLFVSDGPQNKLEINADPDTTIYTGVGGSGLRFRQLRDTSATQANPGVVLSVDSVGNVILVDDAGGGDISACAAGIDTNRLTKWNGANEICESIVYEDAGTRIGIDIFSSLLAKLHVNNTSQAIGVYTLTTGGSIIGTGMFGHVLTGNRINYGVRGEAGSGSTCFPANLIGLIGNHGIFGRARGHGTLNVGGQFESIGTSGRSFGIYSRVCAGPANFAGVFIGDVTINGVTVNPSDSTLKDSVENITGALSLLFNLSSKEFVFKTSDFPYLSLPEGKQYGFISQEVESTLPELVKDITYPEMVDENDSIVNPEMTIKALNYIGLIPLLVSGINELSTKTVTTCEPTTLTDFIPKWNDTLKTLCNSIIYDNGNQIGINTTEPKSKTTILNGSVPASFSSGIAELEEDFDLNIASENIALTVFSSTGDTINIGSMFIAENDEAVNIGGGSTAHGDDAIINLGWASTASGAQVEKVNVALLGTGSGEGSANYGVAGQAEGGAESIGVYGLAETDETGYGIYGDVDGSSPDLYAGWFNGDVTVTGTFHNPSDSKLKDNVEDISNAMNLLNELQPKNFEYKTSDYKDLNLPEGNQYGLIAQEVEAVLPELVRDITSPTPRDKNGKATGQRTQYKGVNYTGFIPLLIKGLQEQQAVIDSMSKRLAEVESRVDNCCGGTGFKTSGDDDNVNRLTVELASLQAVVLDQNVPNPFAEQTSISYFIPEENTTDNTQPATGNRAQIVFFDITGRVIKTVDVQKGYGIMTVFAHNLSTGSYSYSLMLDGKAVETKRMVKMK